MKVHAADRQGPAGNRSLAVHAVDSYFIHAAILAYTCRLLYYMQLYIHIQLHLPNLFENSNHVFWFKFPKSWPNTFRIMLTFTRKYFYKRYIFLTDRQSLLFINKGSVDIILQLLLAYCISALCSSFNVDRRRDYVEKKSYTLKVDSHLTTRHRNDTSTTQEKNCHTFTYNDMTQTRYVDTTTTDDAVLQVIPGALILVLCHQQVTCTEMFSEEKLICIAVLL
jgi:hypothetical protein